MTHTRICLTPSRLPERPPRWLWQGLLKDADQTPSCLRCGQNSRCICHPAMWTCENSSSVPRFLTDPFVPPGSYFHAGGHSLTIRVAVLSSAQCQTILGERGGQSSCDSYKVAEGTVYFSWSASNERAANSNKSQLCNAATFPL